MRQLTIICVSVLFLALGACDDDDDVVEPIGGAPFGERCTLDTDCADGLCLVNDQFPFGFCTERCNASAANTCGFGHECLDLGGVTGGVCLASCGEDLDCDDIGLDLTCNEFGQIELCSNQAGFLPGQ